MSITVMILVDFSRLLESHITGFWSSDEILKYGDH